MNKTFPILTVAAAIAAATVALPVHAAVIDAIQNKVNAIKNDTSTIKNKVNKQLGETMDIRDALDPLFTMRARLTAMGIDPAEFLDMIPADEIRDAIDEVRGRQQEVQDAMNDPNLEVYRYELLDLLAGISFLTAENGVVQVSPLQTLVENAPTQVLAVLKIATDEVFGELTLLVAEQIELMTQLRELGLEEGNPLFDFAGYGGNPNSPYRSSGARFQPVGFTSSPGQVQLVQDTHQGVDAGVAAACSLWGGALHVPVFLIGKLQVNQANLIGLLGMVEGEAKKTNTEVPVQVHGYAGLSIQVGENTGIALQILKNRVERKKEVWGLRKEAIQYLSLSGLCGAYGALAPTF